MIEVPGHRVVGFRPPRKGELFLSNDDAKPTADLGRCLGHHVIVEPVWQWPDWLGGTHIAMDESGGWYVYDGKRYKGFSEWYAIRKFSELNPALFDIDLPKCDDWTNSLIAR